MQKEILRLWLLRAKKQIAGQLGFDVETVRRYLAAAKALGVEQAHGLAALDDELVAAVVAATQPSQPLVTQSGHAQADDDPTAATTAQLSSCEQRLWPRTKPSAAPRPTADGAPVRTARG